MDQCSEYIAKLEGYRKNSMWWLPEKWITAWGRSIQKFIEQELTEFYTNFDSTFYNCFQILLYNLNCF
jgi:hypothetical protein